MAFWINAPIGLVNLVIAARALPYADRSRRPFDPVSATLNAVAFGLFFVGVDAFTHGGGAGNSAIGVAELVVAAVAGVVLVRREAGAAAPLIPIDLLRIRMFSLSVATSICSFAAQALAFVALPFYFELELGRTQVETGLLMTPWPVAVGFAAPLAGRLSDRFPAAILGSIGLAALTAGLALMARLPPHPTFVDIAWPMAICGAGFGFFRRPTIASCCRRRRASVPAPRAGCSPPRGSPACRSARRWRRCSSALRRKPPIDRAVGRRMLRRRRRAGQPDAARQAMTEAAAGRVYQAPRATRLTSSPATRPRGRGCRSG